MDHFALLIKLRGDSTGGGMGDGGGGGGAQRLFAGGSGMWLGGGIGAGHGMMGDGHSHGAVVMNSMSPQAEAMGELNRLAHDLMNTNQKRPEPWLAVSLMCLQ